MTGTWVVVSGAIDNENGIAIPTIFIIIFTSVPGAAELWDCSWLNNMHDHCIWGIWRGNKVYSNSYGSYLDVEHPPFTNIAFITPAGSQSTYIFLILACGYFLHAYVEGAYENVSASMGRLGCRSCACDAVAPRDDIQCCFGLCHDFIPNIFSLFCSTFVRCFLQHCLSYVALE